LENGQNIVETWFMIKRTKAENLERAVLSLEKSLASPVTEERDLEGIVKSLNTATSYPGIL
jgi:hypothetical protein